MVSLSAKAVCIIDCHNKLVYMNDFYQNLFNEEKIGYMVREEPSKDNPDSGWRFFAGDESKEYNSKDRF